MYPWDGRAKTTICKQFSAARPSPVPGSRGVLALHVLLALQLVHGGDDARHLRDVDAPAVVHIVDSEHDRWCDVIRISFGRIRIINFQSLVRKLNS